MKWSMLILALLGTLAASAQCIKGDCYTGHGTYLFEDGSRYVGQFRSGKLHGKGILYSENGDKYLGDWVKNKKQGRGKLIFSSGEHYIGDFSNNKFHGFGKLTTLGGDVIEGQWKKNTFLEDWDDQVAIEEDSRSAATEVSQVKPRKTELKDCTLTYSHNTEGKLTYVDGSVYTGWFVDGQPEGQGSCLYANGDKYVGGWKNHGPHGEGVMYFMDGRVYGAEWEKGRAVAELAPEASLHLMQDIMEEKTPEVKVWAVVIGVSRYNHMPVLRYADDDAYRFYAFLKSPEGGALPDEQIAILIDEDATRDNTLRKMQETVLRADENDVVVVYFSGHGLDGAFLPIDYDGYNNRIFYDEMTEILAKSKARHKMCFADACHSGSLLAQKGPAESQMMYYKAFDNILSGTAFMLSSKAEEFSLEDGGLRQGVFSHFLIKGIKGAADTNSDKVVTISELFAYVHFEVRKYSGNLQTPIMLGQYDQNMPVGVVR
jgi:hypothetical protein